MTASKEDLNEIIRAMSDNTYSDTIEMSLKSSSLTHLRAAVAQIGGIQRSMELTIESKLLMIEQCATQEPERHRQQLVVSLLTSCRLHDLYELKDAFDIGRVEMDLARLIFNWMEDDSLRAIALTHIKIQSKAILEEEGYKRPLRVLSDIDDTLVHSGFGMSGEIV